MSFFSIHLKRDDRKLIEIAKQEFLCHHPEWEIYQISNRKIIFESLRYYIRTGKYKDQINGDRKDEK